MSDNLPRLGDTIRDDEGATLFVIDIVPGQLGEWVTCSRVGCLGYYIQRPIDEVTVIERYHEEAVVSGTHQKHQAGVLD